MYNPAPASAVLRINSLRFDLFCLLIINNRYNEKIKARQVILFCNAAISRFNYFFGLGFCTTIELRPRHGGAHLVRFVLYSAVWNRE